MFVGVYRVFAYFTLASIFGVFLHGFRYDPAAPASNYLFNIAMYGLWAGVHLVMTRAWFKQAVYGSPLSSGGERRIFIGTTIVTWLALLWFHLPVPGFSLQLPGWVGFGGIVGVVFAIICFYEGVTFAALDGLLGMPGSDMTHSHGAETPLLTDGQYARVRHPMYRAALLGGVFSLLVHPHAGQLLWALMIGGTFVAFVPIEEGQLIEARGEAYRAYMEATPWRVFRGVW
jgi:protein-S-isoprenylcysteine O-methyltransferase Ste14